MSMARPLVTYLAIIAASVGTSVVVTRYSDDKNNALKIQLEQTRVEALKKVCEQTVADRRILIRKGRVEARGNEAIAADPTTSDRAREIRRRQARVEREAVADLRKRVRAADCNIK